MVEITVLELNFDEGSFTAALPFSGVTDGGEVPTDGDESDSTDDDEESGGRSKTLAILGVFVFLVVAAAIVKYLKGGEEPDVEIETPDDGPVGVTVDTEDN